MFVFDDCIAFLAGRVSKQLSEIHERKLKEADITRTQWMSLYYIRNSENITQKELAELLGSKEPTIVRLLDRMEKEGSVERIHKDRRTNGIRLTEEGEERYERGLVITETFKDKSLEGISEESMETFKRVLDKLIANNETENE